MTRPPQLAHHVRRPIGVSHQPRPWSKEDDDALDRILAIRADDPYAPAIPVHDPKPEVEEDWRGGLET